MAGLFSKLFGKKDDASEQQTESPVSEAERKVNEIRDEVMNLESKGRAIGADMDRLRAEIRQKEQANQKLMDEYESLEDGLEKEMVMGRLAAYEDELEGLCRRVNGLSKAWGENAKLIQTMKQVREKLQAALSAGRPPEELARIIHEVAAQGSDYDIGVGLVSEAADELGGASSDATTDANREKVLARLAARKGKSAQPASQPQAKADRGAEDNSRTTSTNQY